MWHFKAVSHWIFIFQFANCIFYLAPCNHLAHYLILHDLIFNGNMQKYGCCQWLMSLLSDNLLMCFLFQDSRICIHALPCLCKRHTFGLDPSFCYCEFSILWWWMNFNLIHFDWFWMQLSSLKTNLTWIKLGIEHMCCLVVANNYVSFFLYQWMHRKPIC